MISSIFIARPRLAVVIAIVMIHMRFSAQNDDAIIEKAGNSSANTKDCEVIAEAEGVCEKNLRPFSQMAWKAIIYFAVAGAFFVYFYGGCWIEREDGLPQKVGIWRME